jgi:hypothetical protein
MLATTFDGCLTGWLESGQAIKNRTAYGQVNFILLCHIHPPRRNELVFSQKDAFFDNEVGCLT